VPRTSFSVSQGGRTIAEAPTGLTKLDVEQGSSSVQTLAGKVRAVVAGTGTQVIMAAPDLEVRHLVGRAYGSIVQNTGNNRTIDTSTIIDIDLSNLPPLSIGTTWFRLQNIALDSATRLGR
jgi:hypothetical protein